jgi:glyoxylase-like metal-dependent hydrolase (beta-lactamase superfamily II)
MMNNRKNFLLIFMMLFVGNVFAEKTKYPPISVPMELKKVSEHVYYVQGEAGVATDNEGFISNAGFIVTHDGVVVFDALGTPSLGNNLLQKIRSVTSKPIVKVIVSHYHADHIYGLQVFSEMGAEIISPKGSMDYLNSPQAEERLEERRFSLDPWVNDSSQLIPPDRIVSKSESFSLGGVNFIISYLGSAHSDGDLTLYVESDRVLFSGDIIFEGRIAYLGDSDTKLWASVLGKIKTDELVALVPGHGPLARDPNKAISMTLNYLNFVRDNMGKAANDLLEFDEAYKAVDWSAFSRLPAFDAANRRNAYQVYLSMEAEMLQ